VMLDRLADLWFGWVVRVVTNGDRELADLITRLEQLRREG
jgi:hypothetical protein